jgi:subtilase family serine protease
VRTFLELCGLQAATWTQLRPDGEPNPNPGSEATLDLTVVAGLLPQNTILETATVADGDFVDALLNAAHACGLQGDDPSTWARAQLDTPSGGCIVSMSYAVFEKSVTTYLDNLGFNTPQLQTEYLEAADEILIGMASSGVVTLVSSGDEGSGGCQPSSRGQRDQMAPQWPSTSPHVLSVGGTMWAPPDWNGAPITPTAYVPGSQYQPVAWRNWDLGSDCYWDVAKNVLWPGVGTTGGESGADFYARPSYQDGVASAVPGSTGRLSPDVSALAGWPTWLVPQVNDGNAYSYEMGTSAAAPLTAVGLAHVNAALTARGLSPLDNAGGSLDVHTVFYSDAFSPALNDVTEGSSNLWSSDIWSGTNPVTSEAYLKGEGSANPFTASPFLSSGGSPLANGPSVITGYSAKVGYDLTTGMGVPNFSTLATLLIEAQTVAYDPQGPDPVLQQVPIPTSGSCADVDDSKYNWGGAGSGGWGQSWAQWADAGQGGPVCTRTLIYNSSFGIWVVQR